MVSGDVCWSSPWKAVATKIPFETISTGMMSKGLGFGMCMNRRTPIVPRTVRPPAADMLSVHPLNGCSRELAMMDGRQMTHFTSPWFFLMYFSARFLVKVYVFGKLPISFFSLSFTYCRLMFMILLTVCSTS